MKGLVIWLEALATSAVICFVLSGNHWHSPVGYIIAVVVIALILFGAFIYGAVTIDVGKERSRAYQLGLQEGKRRW